MPALRSTAPSSTSATPSHDRAGRQRGLAHRDGTMAVAVGLHHRAHLGRAHEVDERLDVLRDGREVDLGPSGAHLLVPVVLADAGDDGLHDVAPGDDADELGHRRRPLAGATDPSRASASPRPRRGARLDRLRLVRHDLTHRRAQAFSTDSSSLRSLNGMVTFTPKKFTTVGKCTRASSTIKSPVDSIPTT